MAPRQAGDALKNIILDYTCEWPLEIIIDKQESVKKYNKIFSLLATIKYARFIMEKRDFHIKKPNLLRNSTSYSAGKKVQSQLDDMGVEERLLIENELMLGQLIQ